MDVGENRKAGGADGILAELLVYGADVNEEENEQSLIETIHTLFVKVFECGTIPRVERRNYYTNTKKR